MLMLRLEIILEPTIQMTQEMLMGPEEMTAKTEARASERGRRRRALVKSWPRGQEVGRLLFCASPTVARHFARKIM